MTPPRLLVDARAPYGSGLGRYLRESVVALAQLGCFSEIVLVGPADALAPTCAQMAGSVRVRSVPWHRYDVRVLTGWAGAIADLVPGAVTWLPYWDVPWRAPWSGTPAYDRRRPVMTLHDLILHDAGGLRGVVARQWMRRSIASCRAFVAPSVSAREAFVQAFPALAGRITVVPHGVSSACVAAGDRAAGPTRQAAPNGTAPFLLCVANKRPHKRIEVAIAAFAELAHEDARLRLVLVGDRTPHLASLEALARRLGVDDRIDDLTGLSDEALAARYAAAEAVLVCSQAEGFGMVPLEAMAAGAPVVAARHPTTCEVVGDGAVIVEPEDPQAMAAVIRGWRADPTARAAQIRRGRAQAARYHWERSARALAGVLLAAET